MTLENTFSWSKSRDEEFRECQRKYYYDKYASWGGWERNAPPLARQAYVLKNLKNRWAWKGETVHHVIEHVLKSIRHQSPLSLEVALKELTTLMRVDYRSSKAKKYWQDPKNCVGLFEHEYQKPVPDGVWKEIHESAAACLRNFYASPLFQELRADNPENWLAIEELEDFEFQGAKVYVKLDFARKKESLLEIYDWKTGKAEVADAGVQMGVYAIYAMQKWGVSLADIRGYLVNLSAAAPRPDACQITQVIIDQAQKTMSESIAGMRLLLEDPAKNVPLPSEHFLFTDNTRSCSHCNFYKICEKYQA